MEFCLGPINVSIKNYPIKLKGQLHMLDKHGGNYEVGDRNVYAKVNLCEFFTDIKEDFVADEFSHDYLMEIKKIFEIIPFCRYVKRNRGSDIFEYIPGIEYNTIEELELRQKPIEMIEFMGIQIPKAIYRKMKFIKKMFKDVSEYTISINDFPEKIRAYVSSAINKLKHISGTQKFTIEDMAVYDFLEVLGIFQDNITWFISGDKLIKYDMINLLRCGLFNCPKLVFKFNITKPHELLTDTIVEVSAQYYNMVKKLNKSIDFRLSYVDFRTLKIIGERGHL